LLLLFQVLSLGKDQGNRFFWGLLLTLVIQFAKGYFSTLTVIVFDFTKPPFGSSRMARTS